MDARFLPRTLFELSYRRYCGSALLVVINDCGCTEQYGRERKVILTKEPSKCRNCVHFMGPISVPGVGIESYRLCIVFAFFRPLLRFGTQKYAQTFRFPHAKRVDALLPYPLKNPLARIFSCARGGNRTHTTLRSANFKSAAYTNFATRAFWLLVVSY